MKTARLTRLETSDEGTFGLMQVLDEKGLAVYECATLELPWRDNEHGKSCIPAGAYVFRWRTDSPKHGEVYEAKEVPGRSEIQIHPANLAGDESKGYVKQLDGCIAPGRSVMTFKAGLKPADMRDQRGISVSKNTTAELVAVLKKESFVLEVHWALGVGPKEA